MKKLYQILLILLLLGCSDNQKSNLNFDVNLPKVNNSTSKNKQSFNYNYYDTTFIVREFNPEYYHKIYIERNRSSKYYQALTNFTFDENESQDFNDYNKFLKQKAVPIKKFDLKGLPKDWLPIYKYKNKYYLYAPSDWGNVGRRILTDSSLIYWYMDGPYPFVLTDVEKTDQYKYIIKSKDYIGASEHPIPKEKELDIYMIDEKNKIAVWDYKDEKIKAYRFQLYIPKENAKNYEIIVNRCDQSKTMEFDFETVDFKKLLKL